MEPDFIDLKFQKAKDLFNKCFVSSKVKEGFILNWATGEEIEAEEVVIKFIIALESLRDS